VKPIDVRWRNVSISTIGEESTVNIAILVPCYNEAKAIPSVVSEFRQAVPTARIYVYDNNSQDRTAEVALAAGALVRREERQGKGNVVRRMFADVDADVYVLVDGDGTYDARSAPRLIEVLLSGPYDMVNVARDSISERSFRKGHRFGNWLLTHLVALIFGNKTTDMLSGYKAFSRRFVKTFPAVSRGFEIEAELVVHALELRVPMTEIRASYGERPEGSPSKLNAISDGLKILRLIGFCVTHERPLAFFGIIAFLLTLFSLLLGIPVCLEFLRTGLVHKLPSAVAAATLMLGAMVSVTCGLIFDAVTHGRREAKRLAYLQIPCRSSNGANS
jgi:glycosyltransferase involved in cell wall biosynthesis